jgi:hypothetical protein
VLVATSPLGTGGNPVVGTGTGTGGGGTGKGTGVGITGVIGIVDALIYSKLEPLIYAPKSIAGSLYIVLDSRMYIFPTIRLFILKSGIFVVFLYVNPDGLLIVICPFIYTQGKFRLEIFFGINRFIDDSCVKTLVIDSSFLYIFLLKNTSMEGVAGINVK